MGDQAEYFGWTRVRIRIQVIPTRGGQEGFNAFHTMYRAVNLPQGSKLEIWRKDRNGLLSQLVDTIEGPW